MKRSIGLCLIWILLAAMAAMAEGTEDLVPVVMEKQLVDCRYSLGKEKDRVVLDLNGICAYEVSFNAERTAVQILLDATDVRRVQALKAKDKVVQRITVAPYAADPTKTLIQLMLNYRVPVEIAALSEPNRLVIDVQKIFQEEKLEDLGRGIKYRSIYAGTVYGPLKMEVAEIDVKSGVTMKPIVAYQGSRFGRQTVSELAKQHGALLAINGGYFASNGQPLGTLVVDGKLLAYPYANRTALLMKNNGEMWLDNVQYRERILLADGKELQVDGINKVRSAQQLVLYDRNKGTETTETNEFGWEVLIEGEKVTEMGTGNLKIKPQGYVLSAHGLAKKELEVLQVGDRIQRVKEFTPDWTAQGITQILSGGPRLVREGKVFVAAIAEKFRSDVARGRAPRSALGLTADGKLLLVAVSGRQPDYSVGVTLNELAEYLVAWGATEAMNLDGGGSTAFWVQDRIVNQPSEGEERKVSHIFLVK